MRSIILLGLLVILVPARADAATVIENPAQAPEPKLVLEAVEEWSVGGADDEEVLFGVIADLDVDAEGNAYVSDRQLTEVSKFSPDGEFLGFIGREGEGPGEYRRIGSLFVTPWGDVAVMKRMPGQIITVQEDGTAGRTIELPDFLTAAPAYFFGGDMVGQDLVLSVRRFARSDAGMDLTTMLVRIDAEGEVVARMSESMVEQDLAVGTVDEKENARILWTFDDRGQVYVYDGWDDYVIEVYDAEGTLIREMSRDYQARERNSREKEINTPHVAIQRAGGRRRDLEGIPSDTDRDIQDLFARPGGVLWVLSSRGAFDNPEGVLMTVDEFDADGRYLRQVEILGEGDLQDDGLELHGDRLFLLHERRAALANSRGFGDEEDEEAQPMSITAYRLVGP